MTSTEEVQISDTEGVKTTPFLPVKHLLLLLYFTEGNSKVENSRDAGAAPSRPELHDRPNHRFGAL